MFLQPFISNHYFLDWRIIFSVFFAIQLLETIFFCFFVFAFDGYFHLVYKSILSSISFQNFKDINISNAGFHIFIWETFSSQSFSTLLLIQGFFPPILYIFSSSFQKFYSDVSKCFVLHPLSLFFFDLQSFQILWLDFVGQFW